MPQPRLSSTVFAMAALVVGSLLASPGCGGPTNRITPATLDPDQARQLERDLDAAADAERSLMSEARQ